IAGSDCDTTFISGLVYSYEYWTCSDVSGSCESLVAAINIPNDPIICFGDTIPLIAEASGGTPPYSYSWHNGATTQSTHSLVEPNAFFTLVVVDDNGCAYTAVLEPEAENCGTDTTGCDVCPAVYDPVCVNTAGQTITFENSCFAICAGYDQSQWVSCEPDSTNCDFCPEIYDPVCVATAGGNILTFQNSCYAECEGYDDSIWYACDSTNTDCNGFAAIITVSNNEICIGDSVTFNVTATGGTPPYAYDWGANLGTDPTITLYPTNSQQYYVTIADQAGCVITLTTEVHVELCGTDTTGCDVCPAVYDPVCVNTAGQTITFENSCFATCAGYDQSQWVSCESDSSNCDACPAIYDPVCVATPNGGVLTFQNSCYAECEGYDDSIWYSCDSTNTDCNGFAATVTASNLEICIGDSVTLNVTATGGTPPYAYDWGSNLGTNPTITLYPTNSQQYYVTIADQAGCVITLTTEVHVELCGTDSLCTDSMNCVFPGDANRNYVVNNYDLLNIGFSYGETGPARSLVSIAPQFFFAADWNASGINGVNSKHADCNGDGTIDQTDIEAIEQNYNADNEFDETPMTSEPGISVSIDFNTDTLFFGNEAGDSGTLIVEAGLYVNQTATMIPMSGMAFQINFNDGGVLISDATVEFDDASWLTSNNDAISFERFLPDMNRLDLAISRTDQTPVTGSGRIGTITLAIEDIIIGRNSDENVVVQAVVENVVAVNDVEGSIEIIGETNEIVLSGSEVVTGQRDNVLDQIEIYPNPAQHTITINSNIDIEALQLISLDGRIVKISAANKSKLNVSDLPANQYFLRVITTEGVFVRKIIKSN
ncbi:MAG: T9SS type A sorting domain-containing protein, partial [Hyphomicrobiales bacterium]|nr:T9SS type A sorting domain-containing protein [Hyphomicrobiales bacterium]